MAKKQTVTIYSCITDDRATVRMSTHPDLTSDNTDAAGCPVFTGPVVAYLTSSYRPRPGCADVDAEAVGWNSCRSSVAPCSASGFAMFLFAGDGDALSWLLGERGLDQIADGGYSCNRREYNYVSFVDGKTAADFPAKP